MEPTDPAAPATAPASRLERHQDRFGRLLVVLVAVFLLQGIEGSGLEHVLSAVVTLGAIVVAAATTGVPHRFRTGPFIGVLLALGVAAVALITIGTDTTTGIGSICSAAVLGGLLVVVLNRILNHHDVQAQTIAGAMCAYLLFGMFFGAIFAAMNTLDATPVFNHHMANSDYGYFSISTLTTVGYGDITAVGGFARRLTGIEAITGQMFLATAVARLMSVARITRRGETEPAAD